MWEGKVTKIHFRSDDFVIAKLSTQDETITILGEIYGLNEGDVLKVEGEKEIHKKYGEQIKITKWEKPIPTTTRGVIDFLSSGLIKGVGVKRAMSIVQELGADALSRIINEGPDILRSVSGIGSKADQIFESINKHIGLQNVIQELIPFGVTTKSAKKAYNSFGPGTIEIIKKNPYRLMEIELIGFQKADSIAFNMGISKNSNFRIQAAIIHSLTEASREGHCFMPEEELLETSLKFLNHSETSVSKFQAIAALRMLQKEKRVVSENKNIYLPQYYYAEIEVARKVSLLCSPSVSQDVSPLIHKYELKTGIQLALNQKQAVQKIFNTNLLILTGGPGTGKTETIKAIVDIYKTLFPGNMIFLAAPTGRASRRMSEITGMDACTIHRLLGIQPGRKTEYNSENPLPCKLLIIDEVSMLDISLAKQLFTAIDTDTKVLLVGDKDQLPSVGPGNVLKDLLDADIPAVHLDEIFRQAKESQIVTNSHRVNRGEKILIDSAKDDFFFIIKTDFKESAQTVEKCVLRLLQKGYSLDEIQVLSPMRKLDTGINNLNAILQEALKQPGKKQITRGKSIYREGDKVIHLKNNYDKDVFNGDVGVIVKIASTYDEDGELLEEDALHVKYNGKTVTYTREELDQLELAYAITVHKAQGGEYRAVIMVLTTQHYVMLARNLLYTGMTRAKEMFVLIGCNKALNIAIKNNAISKRNTGLANRINIKKESVVNV